MDQTAPEYPPWVDEMLELQSHLNTPLQMSEKLGVSRGAIYYWLDKLGREPWRMNIVELTGEEKRVATAAYRGGAKVSEIARCIDRPYSQVWYLVRNEVPPC
jgi:transposase-like protein